MAQLTLFDGEAMIDVGGKAFLKYFTVVLARKTCLWNDRWPLRRCAIRLTQWFGVAHQAPEQADVVA